MRDAGIIGFVPRGEYSSTETYDFLQFVYYDGSTYVAKKETTGNTPAENNEFWQILAKGRVGDYLPMTGGTLEGNSNPLLKLLRTGGNFIGLEFENQNGHIFVIEGYSGENGQGKQLNIFARDWGKSLLRINEDNRVIYDHKTQSEKKILVEGEALPATGGTLKSTDYFPLHLERTTEGTGCGLDFKGTDGSVGNIQMTYDTYSNNENEFRCFVKDEDKKDVGVLRVSRENRKIYCKETGGTKNIITDYEVPFRFGINSAGDYGYYRNDTGEFVKI